MPRLLATALFLFCALEAVTPDGCAAPAALTALGAVKLLPKGMPAQVTSIAAFEGKPVPERWHILVNDPGEESGVREFIVARGALTGSYTVSQFADKLTPNDIIGAQNVKVDSDRAARLAQDYARANALTITSFNYELRKDETEGAPLWRITCLGPEGQAIGTLVLLASKGTVIAHDGFDADPPVSALIDKTPGSAAPAVVDSSPEAGPAERPPPRAATPPPAITPRPEPRRPPASTPRPRIPVATPLPLDTPLPPDATPERRPTFLRRVFGGRSRDAQ